MKIRLRTLILAWVVILIACAWVIRSSASLDNRVKLTGGSFPTKSLSVWELEKYKRTTLMRKNPLKWCPWVAYLAVDEHVHIQTHDNMNWLVIDADLTSLVAKDASFNKDFAKRFKTSGTRKQKIRQIYRYCRQTTYTPHVKGARSVFQSRQGDCSAIAAAFYVLCKAKKIPVRYVIGWCRTGCHAWNRVKLKGKWYWICATQGFWLQRRLPRYWKVMDIW